MEYQLCEAKTARKLQRAVNRSLADGWRPVGGVAVTQSNSTANWWYYQALVREPAPASLASVTRGATAKPPANGLGDFD